MIRVTRRWHCSAARDPTLVYAPGMLMYAGLLAFLGALKWMPGIAPPVIQVGVVLLLFQTVANVFVTQRRIASVLADAPATTFDFEIIGRDRDIVEVLKKGDDLSKPRRFTSWVRREYDRAATRFLGLATPAGLLLRPELDAFIWAILAVLVFVCLLVLERRTVLEVSAGFLRIYDVHWATKTPRGEVPLGQGPVSIDFAAAHMFIVHDGETSIVPFDGVVCPHALARAVLAAVQRDAARPSGAGLGAGSSHSAGT